MKIEDRVRDALHEYADGIEPEPDSWARISRRITDLPEPVAARRSRRPLVLTGVAVALVVVVIGALVVRTRDDHVRVSTAPSTVTSAVPAVEPPVGIVVAKRDGELVMFGEQDGRQHSSLGTFPGISGISITPDPNRRDVFLTATGRSGACGNGPYDDVTKLDPATGKTERIQGGAAAAVVSPSGTWLATGVTCDGPALGFQNLVTRAAYGSDALGSKATERSPSIDFVEPLGWSPNSVRLVYRVHLKEGQTPRYYVGRLWPIVRQAQTQVVPLPGGAAVSAATFVDDGHVALAEATGAGSTDVRSWTVATGASKLPSPVLFRVRGRVVSLVADPSGQHLLAVTDAGELYRWSRGEALPTLVASGVAAAVWVPYS